jgi:hypothetical protein
MTAGEQGVKLAGQTPHVRAAQSAPSPRRAPSVPTSTGAPGTAWPTAPPSAAPAELRSMRAVGARQTAACPVATPAVPVGQAAGALAVSSPARRASSSASSARSWRLAPARVPVRRQAVAVAPHAQRGRPHSAAGGGVGGGEEHGRGRRGHGADLVRRAASTVTDGTPLGPRRGARAGRRGQHPGRPLRSTPWPMTCAASTRRARSRCCTTAGGLRAHRTRRSAGRTATGGRR